MNKKTKVTRQYCTEEQIDPFSLCVCSKTLKLYFFYQISSDSSVVWVFFLIWNNPIFLILLYYGAMFMFFALVYWTPKKGNVCFTCCIWASKNWFFFCGKVLFFLLFTYFVKKYLFKFCVYSTFLGPQNGYIVVVVVFAYLVLLEM